MRQVSTTTVILLALAALCGCEADRMSEKGFSLPEGNAIDGHAIVLRQCSNGRQEHGGRQYYRDFASSREQRGTCHGNHGTRHRGF